MVGFTNDMEHGQDPIYGRYEGKYILVFPVNGPTFAGRLVKIKDGYLFLNPFQGGEYGKDGLVRKMIAEDLTFDIGKIVCVEPTTRENLEIYCEFMNQEDRRDREAKEAERKSKLDPVKK